MLCKCFKFRSVWCHIFFLSDSGIVWCLAVMLVLFNKAALSSYNFPSVNFITLIQVENGTIFYNVNCQFLNQIKI